MNIFLESENLYGIGLVIPPSTVWKPRNFLESPGVVTRGIAQLAAIAEQKSSREWKLSTQISASEKSPVIRETMTW